MLRFDLIHPTILAALGRAGHHSTVLIADGNFPASTAKGSNAELVHLNLMPGLLNCNQVLQALLTAIPVEAVTLMMYQTEGPYALKEEPPVWADYRRSLSVAGVDLTLSTLEMVDFYAAVATQDHVLTIQTGDQQRFANILIKTGVRMD